MADDVGDQIAIGLASNLTELLDLTATIVELGGLDPESVVTPGIFVHQIVQIDRVATQAGGIKKAA